MTAIHILAEALQKVDPKTVNENFAKMYFPNGKALTEGAMVTNPALADTLQKIADKGVDVFYDGSVGQVLVKEVIEKNVHQPYF